VLLHVKMATHHTHHKRPTITANCKKARDVVIAVRLDRKAAAAIDGVTRWVTGTLGKLYPVPEEVPNSSSSYPCAVVSGTHHDDWADGETEEVYNRILLVCHRSWGAPCNHIVVNSDQSCDGMTVVAEHDNEVGDQFLLCPELIRSELEVQQNAPAGVTAVGVSGVSERYAAAVWRQIISTTRERIYDSSAMDVERGLWYSYRTRNELQLRVARSRRNLRDHGQTGGCKTYFEWRYGPGPAIGTKTHRRLTGFSESQRRDSSSRGQLLTIVESRSSALFFSFSFRWR
jgi:hypothetical protein